MKHPKLTFCKSSKKNLKYKIFRFNSPNDFSIDYFINNKENLLLSEKTYYNSKIIEFPNFQMTKTDSDIDPFILLSTPFEFIKTNTPFHINFKNNILSKNNSRIKIYIGADVISKIEYLNDTDVIDTITDQSVINNLIRINKANSIYLNKDEFDYLVYTIDANVEIISLTDNEAHGIFKPTISRIDTNDYVIFYQDKATHKNTYYYKAVGYDENNVFTDLSYNKAIEIWEDNKRISTIVEYNDGSKLDGKLVWKEVQGVYSPDSEIKIYKDKSQLSSETVPNIYQHEIKADDRLLVSDGLRVLKIANVWHNDKSYMMLRPCKTYRFKNVYKPYKVDEEDEAYNIIETEYTDIFRIFNNIEVLIDKMVILRKDVTRLSTEDAKTPIELNDKEAETLKIYVRQGGIYYNDYLTSQNENDSDIVSSITTNSRFPLFNIKDNCIYSNKYNYTVYLFDEIGNISKPVSIVF